MSPSSVSTEPGELGSCEESSTDFLLDVVAAYCADKSHGGKRQLPERSDLVDSGFVSFSIPGMAAYKSLTPLNEQLPDKITAKTWITAFLGGPNLLFRACDEAESWKLLDSIYANEPISHASRCSLWFQLAIGCQLTTDTAKESHVSLFRSGYQYLEWCIEQADEVSPLWVVPTLLLICLYSLGTRPRACWLTLGAAIRLAQVHNIDREWVSRGNLSPEECVRWREVWRAMISLDAYITPSMIADLD